FSVRPGFSSFNLGSSASSNALNDAFRRRSGCLSAGKAPSESTSDIRAMASSTDLASMMESSLLVLATKTTRSYSSSSAVRAARFLAASASRSRRSRSSSRRRASSASVTLGAGAPTREALRAAVLDGAEAEAEAASASARRRFSALRAAASARFSASSSRRRAARDLGPSASRQYSSSLARSTRSRRSASATERRSRAASALELTPIFFGIAAVRGGGGGRWRGVGLERRSDLGGELVCGFVGFPGPGGFVGLSSGFGARIVYACDQLTLYAWSRAGYHFSRSFPLNCIFFYFENLNCILSWASPSFGLYGSAL
ncbi:hypothetical protein EE612_024906, partial [Oryza sativa]